ncbi:MAG: ABC transporter ATP-binding protein [Microbacteriaceae bacterium]|nr:ABC transporter ATP-binding protein [Microbacteriaceae bacterium]
MTKKFGSLTAVNGLDLTVPEGQVLAFLGANGAGKSTVNEMILGLSKPTSGSVRVFGKRPTEAVRAGLVGAMLQNGAMLDGANVRTMMQMMHALHAHPLPLDEVIERADLGDILKTSATKLSGGQAQRVRFALAILPNPQLLILDEPTVAMDVERRQRFWEQIDDFAAGGRTVMFATHYLDEADKFADRIVVMVKGNIVADGSSAEIKHKMGGKKISFVGENADYKALPGVVSVNFESDRHQLVSNDPENTLRALLQGENVRDLEVVSPNLEEAFINLIEEAK